MFSPFQVLDSAFILVEFHKAPAGPFFQPVQVSLNENPALQLQHQTEGCTVSSAKSLIKMSNKKGQNPKELYLEICLQVEFKSITFF